MESGNLSAVRRDLKGAVSLACWFFWAITCNRLVHALYYLSKMWKIVKSIFSIVDTLLFQEIILSQDEIDSNYQ